MSIKFLKSVAGALLILFTQVSLGYEQSMFIQKSSTKSPVIDSVLSQISQYQSKGYSFSVDGVIVSSESLEESLLKLSGSRKKIEIVSPVIADFPKYENLRLLFQGKLTKNEQNNKLIYQVAVRSNYSELGALAFSSLEFDPNSGTQEFIFMKQRMQNDIKDQIKHKIDTLSTVKVMPKLKNIFLLVLEIILPQKAHAAGSIDMDEVIPTTGALLLLGLFAAVFIKGIIEEPRHLVLVLSIIVAFGLSVAISARGD
ncbi:MAG: hypothetical protein HUU56_17945 [Bdellovibrionaceae bacterium]|nr:hypothetical protein [Pseudobdellovibrionaceae bacterium]